MKKIRTMNKTTRTNFITYAAVILAYIVLQLLLSGGTLTSSFQGQLVPICAYIVMAISLNLTVGIMGELSLGHAGFMSVGAFTGVILATALQTAVPSGALRLAIAMVGGGLMAGIFGLIVSIPVLRLRGDYLAIVTLAFGEIIKNIVNCLYVGLDANGLQIGMSASSVSLAEGGKMILNGPMGATGVTKLSTFLAGVILILIALVVVLNLINSRAGRAIMAIRDNRIAAESLGISVTKHKLIAFITSAVLAGMAGVLFAMNYSTVVPKKFDFNTSILILVFVVLGGLGNIWGSIIAAAVLTVLPEVLREFADYRMLVYAIVLILVMLATNSPQIKSFLEKIGNWFKGLFNKKASDEEGGAIDG